MSASSMVHGTHMRLACPGMQPVGGHTDWHCSIKGPRLRVQAESAVRSLPDDAPPDAGGGAARAPRGCAHTGSGAAASSGAAGLPGGAALTDAASPPASATAGRRRARGGDDAAGPSAGGPPELPLEP